MRFKRNPINPYGRRSTDFRTRSVPYIKKAAIMNEGLKALKEVVIDNVRGMGAVPDNQEVDYLGVRTLMKPSVFLELAERRNFFARSASSIANELRDGEAIGAPFLIVKVDEDGDQPAEVMNHEGRNRMVAVQEVEGDDPIEVHIFLAQGMRRRHLTDTKLRDMQRIMISQDGDVVRSFGRNLFEVI
tara:strand:- start:8433 stop:8993 length:561 start_codon:yes stop_codon:yes gene_type:complete